MCITKRGDYVTITYLSLPVNCYHILKLSPHPHELAAIGLFSFLIPAESGFIRELKKIDPTNKDKKIKTAEILGEQIGSNIFFLIPGSSQVIATFLIAFVQNPAIALPVIMPLIGGIVLAFNNVVDFFSETFVK